MLQVLSIDRPRFRPDSPQAYLTAALIIAVATLLQVVLARWLAPFPYVLLFPGVILAAFLCGAGAGLGAAVLAVVAAWLFVFPPELGYPAIFRTGLFLVGAVSVVTVVGLMRVATANVRRSNEILRLSEAQLLDASKAKSDFLARMSHELRTPLNAIIGFSDIMRDALVGPIDARYRDYANDINAAGRHLQRIINDILDISKIEGGGLELQEEMVAIEEVVEECRRIVAAMADIAKVSLAIDLPGFLPPIRADHLRLRQILLNLLSNAVKFTPPGGRVTVTAAVDLAGVAISVEDTGIGMKTEDIAIALTPFRQIEGAMSRRFDGTGLGLPLAKALIERHGGALEIKSAPGVGTAIRIRLPQERVANFAAA